MLLYTGRSGYAAPLSRPNVALLAAIRQRGGKEIHCIQAEAC